MAYNAHMSARTLQLPDALVQYLHSHCTHESDVLRDLRAENSRLPNGHMQICPEQGRFFRFLLATLNARYALELGTFTGYSSIWIASSLAPDGRLICVDLSAENTAIARKYWERAGLTDRIELRLGKAADIVNELARDRAGRFDFIFIDADKEGVDLYYEKSLALVRPGGVIAVDNAFRGGKVADTAAADAGTQALHALNCKVCSDPRVVATLLPIGDGLLLATRR